MFSIIRDCVAALRNHLERAVEDGRTILAITCSAPLQLDLQMIAIRSRWRIRFARSVEAAVHLRVVEPIPLVLYDCELPGGAWRSGFASLLADEAPPLLLLMTPQADRRVWRCVLDVGGFDVVETPLNPERLVPVVNGALALVSHVETATVEVT